MYLQDDYTLYAIRADKAGLVWQEVKPLILAALDYADNKDTIGSIYESILRRDRQLWLVSLRGGIVGAVVTEVSVYPNDKRLTILYLAGKEFGRWVHLWREMKAWAESEGCNSVEIFGREGWEKVLRPLNFKKIHTVLKADF